jgi:hypothetical protein
LHGPPLILNIDRWLGNDESERLAVVNGILAAHPSPTSRLSIQPFSTYQDIDHEFGRWFGSITLDGLHDLMFQGATLMPYCLPIYVFRFAPMLCSVRIWYYYIPKIDAYSMLLFPRLKLLQLGKVMFSSGVAIHRLLAACTALEVLQLHGMHGFNTLCMDSPSLRLIGVADMRRHHCSREFRYLVIKDAPCLERLIVIGRLAPTSVSVMSAPKLTLLDVLPDKSSQLLIGAIDVQVDHSYIFLFLKLTFLIYF